MKRKTTIYSFIILLSFLSGLLIINLVNNTKEIITINSLSPNEHYRVKLIEVKTDFSRVGRNFRITIEHLNINQNLPIVIFNSPDEGLPIGTEEIIWSKDSSKFLIIGNYFITKEKDTLQSGKLLYLLYNLNTKQVNCNALQQNKYPTFKLNNIKGISWSGVNI